MRGNLDDCDGVGGGGLDLRGFSLLFTGVSEFMQNAQSPIFDVWPSGFYLSPPVTPFLAWLLGRSVCLAEHALSHKCIFRGCLM